MNPRRTITIAALCCAIYVAPPPQQSASAAVYATQWKFNGSQNPIYEGNNWSNGMPHGLQWSNCQIYTGYASGVGGHNLFDSVAFLSGTWGPDQIITATLHKGTYSADFEEVELHCRGTMKAHSVKTYEFMFNPSGDESCFIVRWHGDTSQGDPVGFTGIKDMGVHVLNDGDVLRAYCVGNPPALTGYVNSVSIGGAIDAASTNILSGNPGMGFDAGDVGFDFSKIGLSSYFASDGTTEQNVNHIAASASQADFQASLNWTMNTDTNSVPVGTNTWSGSTAMLITNGITVIGGGTNTSSRTLLSDGMADQVYGIQWQVPANATGWLTGFYFTNGRASQDVFQFIDVESADTATSRIRVYGNVWDKLYKQIGFWYGIYGVFDHNTVISKETGVQPVLGYVKSSTINFHGVNAYGDGAWTNALALGSEQFMFFESNDFTNAYNLQNMALIDGQAGARFVIRSNSWFGYNIQCHGLEAERERSGCAFEIYGNTNRGGYDSPDTYLYFRGGVGVVWGETIRGNANTANFSMLNNRTADAEAEPFGGADGQNPWDTNSASNPFVTGTCSSAGALTMTDNTKTWTANQWAGYILRKTSGTAVSSMTRSGGTVTVNATGHGYTSGQHVSIFQQPYTVSSEQPYEGTFICTVVNANQFTVPCDFTPATPATATYLTCSNNYFSEITANTTGGQAAFKDSLFGAALTMTFHPGDTYRINYIEHAMDQIGRRNGSSLDGVLMPTLPSGWNNQVTDPWWSWSNTNLNNNANVFFNPQSGTIRTNIHFITSNTPKPGYSSYQWPHNLVADQPGPAIGAATIRNATIRNWKTGP